MEDQSAEQEYPIAEGIQPGEGDVPSADGQGDYQVGLQIVAPSGKVVDLPLPPVRLQAKKMKARAVVRLAGLPFEEFGTYIFRLVIEKQPQDYPVHELVHNQAQPPQGGKPTGSHFPPPPDFRGN